MNFTHSRVPNPVPGSGSNGHVPTIDFDRVPYARNVRRTAEYLLLALVVISPWLLACNEPVFELLLGAGILALVGLWVTYSTLVDSFSFRPDIVSVSLAGLILWTVVQLVPLPEFIVGIVAPSRLDWHRDLQPAISETLPGGSEPSSRSYFLPLTIETSATRTFLARLFGVLFVYAITRNWLASRELLPKLAWAMVGNGVLLALAAVMQYFSGSKGVVLGLFPIDNTAYYGTFVCRNHYPDYANLCLGFAVALLIPHKKRTPDDPTYNMDNTWQIARYMALTTTLGFLFISIAFSLSRGGLIATLMAIVLTWSLTRISDSNDNEDNKTNPLRFALACAVVVGVILMAWLGSDAIEKRFNSLSQRQEGMQARVPLWKNGLRTLHATWTTGSGAGTFYWLEPTGRIAHSSFFYYDSAHNEYLEAILEGGVIRFGLTLALVVGLLRVVGRGYLNRRDRTVGPLLLGIWFGLVALVTHCVVDFGIHMPAIAVAVATVAGFGVAAATDPAFVPPRVRVRKVRSGDATATVVASDAGIELPPQSANPMWQVSGPSIIVIGAVLGLAGLMMNLEIRGRLLSQRKLVEAEAAFWKLSDPNRLDRRAALLEDRANSRPSDSNAQVDAAQGHIDAAVATTWTTSGGVVGSAMAFAQPPSPFSPSVVEQHIIPALRFLQAARTANPLSAKAHAKLALYCQYFAKSEPATKHFDRAKQLYPTDPDLWYHAGREAMRRGDVETAQSNWQRSLALSNTYLRTILAQLRGHLTTEQLRHDLIPDDPLTLMAAVNELFPDRETQGAKRRPFLDRILELTRARAYITTDELMTRATALDELGQTDEAYEAWVRAVAHDGDRNDVHERFARWLEKEERYEEAIPHLEWLRHRSPNNAPLQDRYDAARHARRLTVEINKD